MFWIQLGLDLLALGAIVSGIFVITSKNPVISVLFLVSVFVNTACYLLLLGVGFVGLSYLIIYVGAIIVLFLFVIMMIHIKLVDLLEVGSQYTQNLPLGFIVTSLFFYEILTLSPMHLNLNSIFDLPLETLNYLNKWFISSDLSDFKWDAYGQLWNSKEILSDYAELWNADQIWFTILQIESLGQGLYSYGSILLMVMGIILLLAMLGPIVLSVKTNQK